MIDANDRYDIVGIDSMDDDVRQSWNSDFARSFEDALMADRGKCCEEAGGLAEFSDAILRAAAGLLCLTCSFEMLVELARWLARYSAASSLKALAMTSSISSSVANSPRSASAMPSFKSSICSGVSAYLGTAPLWPISSSSSPAMSCRSGGRASHRFNPTFQRSSSFGVHAASTPFQSASSKISQIHTLGSLAPTVALMTYIAQTEVPPPQAAHERARLHPSRLRGHRSRRSAPAAGTTRSPRRSSRPVSSSTCRRIASPRCRASAARRRRRPISSARATASTPSTAACRRWRPAPTSPIAT